jgi:hypothetical protein
VLRCFLTEIGTTFCPFVLPNERVVQLRCAHDQLRIFFSGGDRLLL